MRKLGLLLLGVMFLCGQTLAQSRTITGTVNDANGIAIPFATIAVKGSSSATVADANGKYTLQAPPNAVLIFSAAGYEPSETTVGDNSVVNSVLLPQNALNEVVVTALGIQRQRKELGYSTARVGNEQLNQAAPINPANGLQGKVSGLNITSINNGVFGDVKINLRGIRSLTGNNNPMLLLDGVPTPLDYLSSLNPNDIQDVTILKGPSAAAIYGPDAVNGVLVVTTSMGSKGGKPVIKISNTTQWESISFFPEFQTQFGSGGYGDYIPYENWSWGPAFDGSTKPIGPVLEDGSQQEITYIARPDERKNFFNTGITNQTDVSFSTDGFYLSVQDARISGIVPDDKNRRTGVRFNSTREYGKFKAGVNFNYIQQNYNIFDDAQMGAYNAAQNVGLNDGLLNLIFNTPAHIPITSYSDFENNPYATYDGYFNDYGHNPYFALDNWRQTGRNDDLLANLDLNYEIMPGLSLTYRAAASIRNLIAEGTSKGEIPSPYSVANRAFTSIPGSVSERSNRRSRLSSEVFANFTKNLNDDFRLNVIAGQYFRQEDTRDNRVSAANLVVPELFNVSNRTGELGGSNSVTQQRLMSAYGSVGLNYKGWANVEITGRNDWTSLLAKENRSFFYPGVNASFVASDAIPSIANSGFISFMKLRGAWSKNGNVAIAPYSLASTYAQASGFPYGSLPGFTANNTAYDPLLNPEFVTSTEVGLEVGLLRNRINIEAAYFTQDNDNQIIPIRVSDATGFSNSFVNAATFVNKGIEMDLRLTPLVNLGEVKVNFSMNATYMDSKVNSIYQDLDRLFAGGYDNFAANYAITGAPAFVFMLTDYLRDEEGRVIVDAATGYPEVDPNTKQFGRSQPLWTMGFIPNIQWKGISLTAVAEFKTGHYAYHNIGSAMAWTGVSAATARNNRDRFVFPNSSYFDGTKYVENTDIVVDNVNDFYTGVFRDVATNFFTSAASLRIREVSIGYGIPMSLLGNQDVIKGINVSVNARNLALWLPDSNEFTDPDFNFTTTNASGINTSQINPPTRLIGANVTVTF